MIWVSWDDWYDLIIGYGLIMDPWLIRRDMTNVLPGIRARGLLIAEQMKLSGRYSRSQLRKMGLIHNPWKRPPPGWKFRGG